jgi:hypothetical protein
MGYFSPPPAQQLRDSLLATVNTELSEETSQMHMHRGFCHPEARADFLVALAGHQAADYLLLTARQAGKPDRWGCGRPVENIQDCLLSLAAQCRPSLRDQANRTGNLFGCERFEEVAVGASAAPLYDWGFIKVAADDQHRQAGRECLDSCHTGQASVLTTRHSD